MGRRVLSRLCRSSTAPEKGGRRSFSNEAENRLCSASFGLVPRNHAEQLPLELLAYILNIAGGFGFVAQFVSKGWRDAYHLSNAGCAERMSLGENVNVKFVRWAETVKGDITHDTMKRAALTGNCKLMNYALKKGFEVDSDVTALAASAGHLRLLKWLKKTHTCPLGPKVSQEAANKGHTKVLRWTRMNGCPWDASTCSGAAKGGNLEGLQFARAHGCPWDSETCLFAAGENTKEHFKVLKWAVRNGCPVSQEALVSASSCGNLRGLECMVHSLNCSHVSKRVLDQACCSGHSEVVQWLLHRNEYDGENGPVHTGESVSGLGASASSGETAFHVSLWASCTPDEFTAAQAAKSGSMSTLMTLRKHRCPWDEQTTAQACINGHLELLKYAVENGCPIHPRLAQFCLAMGHFQCLLYVRSSACRSPWTSRCSIEAAKRGHLRCLEWAVNHGCTWDRRTIKAAVLYNQPSVLKFALTNHCPWRTGQPFSPDARVVDAVLRWVEDQGDKWAANMCEKAAAKGNIEVLAFAKEFSVGYRTKMASPLPEGMEPVLSARQQSSGASLPSPESPRVKPHELRMCRAAAANGHLSVLRWLRTNGCRWDHTVALAACLNGHTHVFRYLLFQHCPYIWRECLGAARAKGHEDIAEILVSSSPSPMGS